VHLGLDVDRRDAAEERREIGGVESGAAAEVDEVSGGVVVAVLPLPFASLSLPSAVPPASSAPSSSSREQNR
jgi:hypothetical protein